MPSTSAISSVASPPEKAQLDDPALLLVQFGKVIEGVVQGTDVRGSHLRQDEGGIEVDCTIGSAFGRATDSGVIHQNLPHQPRGHG
jgi:hypothetical protein